MKTKTKRLRGVPKFAQILAGTPPAAGEAAHSPLPWSADPEGEVAVTIEDGNGLPICDVYLPDGAENADCPNADFIVRACNSHAALVAALKAILHDHANCVACEQPGFLTDSQVDQARAALNAAKSWASTFPSNEMKIDIHTFKPAELLATIAKVAPSIAIETIWEHDDDIHPDIRKDCEGFENEDPDDWQAWRSEVRASAIIGGSTVSGSDYLGGTWEKAVDHPAKSNPEISGYLPQMIEEAVRELGKRVPLDHPVQREINAVLSII